MNDFKLRMPHWIRRDVRRRQREPFKSDGEPMASEARGSSVSPVIRGAPGV